MEVYLPNFDINSTWGIETTAKIGTLFVQMREEYEKKNVVCQYFNGTNDDLTMDETADDDATRYDETNACRAVKQLVRNNVNWAAKFCIPCDEKIPKFFNNLERRWNRMEKDLRSRLPEELCERQPTMVPIIPYGK